MVSRISSVTDSYEVATGAQRCDEEGVLPFTDELSHVQQRAEFIEKLATSVGVYQGLETDCLTVCADKGEDFESVFGHVPYAPTRA